MIPHGLACQSGLRVGDRILEVNSIDLRHATHQEAVKALLSNNKEIRMLVRRDPSPPGMQVRTHTYIRVDTATGERSQTHCHVVIFGKFSAWKLISCPQCV